MATGRCSGPWPAGVGPGVAVAENAAELTHAWKASSSRQRVTTSHVVRLVGGLEQLEALEAVLVVDGADARREAAGQLVARPLRAR